MKKENNAIHPNVDSLYSALVMQIERISAQAKQKAIAAIDNALVEMNWNVGKYIVDFE